MFDYTRAVIRRAIRQFESGEMKVGSIVFCVGSVQDVILLEVPAPELIEYYYQNQVISGPKKVLKYRSLDGSFEGSENIALFIKISKGKYHADYMFKENNKLAKRESFDFEYAARCEGFKVIRIKTVEGWYIRFFGDTQEDVCSFLNLYLRGCKEDYIFKQ